MGSLQVSARGVLPRADMSMLPQPCAQVLHHVVTQLVERHDEDPAATARAVASIQQGCAHLQPAVLEAVNEVLAPAVAHLTAYNDEGNPAAVGREHRAQRLLQ